MINTQVAGRAIAYLLNELIVNFGFDPSLFTCAGHSLGAHVCAYAGKFAYSNWRWRIGRITGLDPAGPREGVHGKVYKKFNKILI